MSDGIRPLLGSISCPDIRLPGLVAVRSTDDRLRNACTTKLMLSFDLVWEVLYTQPKAPSMRPAASNIGTFSRSTRGSKKLFTRWTQNCGDSDWKTFRNASTSSNGTPRRCSFMAVFTYFPEMPSASNIIIRKKKKTLKRIGGERSRVETAPRREMLRKSAAGLRCRSSRRGVRKDGAIGPSGRITEP